MSATELFSAAMCQSHTLVTSVHTRKPTKAVLATAYACSAQSVYHSSTPLGHRSSVRLGLTPCATPAASVTTHLRAALARSTQPKPVSSSSTQSAGTAQSASGRGSGNCLRVLRRKTPHAPPSRSSARALLVSMQGGTRTRRTANVYRAPCATRSTKGSGCTSSHPLVGSTTIASRATRRVCHFRAW